MNRVVASSARFWRASSLVFAVACLASCGGSSASSDSTTPKSLADVDPIPAPTASPSSASTAAAAAESAPLEWPTACDKTAKSGDVCSVPAKFSEHACSAPNASSIALALFAKGTPWLRMYLARNTEAWNMQGGTRTGTEAAKLAFDEEVLVLTFHPPANTGGMVVSGANGSYDVMRWDGSCATLNADEVRKWYPPEPGYAAIPWRKLDDDMQQKLLGDGRVSLKEGEMKKACKGVSRNESNAACDRAQKSLSKAIVAYVRNGGAVVTPKL